MSEAIPRLKYTEAQVRELVRAGGIVSANVRADQTLWFVELVTREAGLADLVMARKATRRDFRNPAHALKLLRELGIVVAQVYMAGWNLNAEPEPRWKRPDLAHSMKTVAAANKKDWGTEMIQKFKLYVDGKRITGDATDDKDSPPMGFLRDALVDLVLTSPHGLYADKVGESIDGKTVRVEVDGETLFEDVVATGPWHMAELNETLVFADGPRDDEPVGDSQFSYPAAQREFTDAGLADMWLVGRLAKRGIECTDHDRPFAWWPDGSVNRWKVTTLDRKQTYFTLTRG